MERKYCVIFLGISGSKQSFLQNMKNMGVEERLIEYMIEKAPIILKEGLDIRHARLYAEKVEKAGGRVKLKEMGLLDSSRKSPEFYVKGFDNFTVCPQCGYKQDKQEKCLRCGYLLNWDKDG